MQMYVNYFDHYVKTDTEAATVGMRELVGGRSVRGYVALYDDVAAIDTALC